MFVDFRTCCLLTVFCTLCSRSIRVIFNGRRWWYQPQALLSERSGLIETAGVWFVRRLLRAHGYHPTTLEPLHGKSLADVPPQADDVVVPKTLSSVSQSKNPMETVVARVVCDQGSVEENQVTVEFINPALDGSGEPKEDDASKISLRTKVMPKESLQYTSVFFGSGTGNSTQTESMKVDSLPTEEKYDGTGEQTSNKVHADLAGVARLDGSSLESIAKECKKNSESLANIFSAGLPEALLKATETAERQMRSLEPREDLPERISSMGSLTLYIAEQLFSDKPKQESSSDSPPKPDDDSPPPLASRNRRSRTSSHSSNRRNRAAANAAVLAEAEQGASSSSAGLVASLQQRRGLLLSLMSRSRGNGTGNADSGAMEEAAAAALNPIADDLFFSRLPPPGFYGAGDRPALLMGSSGRDASEPGRHLFEAASSSRNNNSNRSTSERNNNQDSATSSESQPTRRSSNNKSFLETVLRSSSHAAKSMGPSSTIFFQHLIRVGLWSNSAAWVKAALDKYIKKSPQKTSTILKQAYDEEGTPILKLAVTFGCSADVVGLLLACGAHVTAWDVRTAIESNQADVLALFLRHASLPNDVDLSKVSPDIVGVVEEARERQDRLDRKMRESAGEFMVDILKRLVDLGLISRRHRTARLESCSRSISEVLVGNVLLRALQQSQATEKKDETEPSEEAMTGRFSIEERLDSHPECGLFGCLPESILGDSLFGTTELATNTFLLLEDFLCSKDMIDSAAGLTALSSLLVKFPCLCSCDELQRYGMLELVSFHDALASSRCGEVMSSHETSPLEAPDEAGLSHDHADSSKSSGSSSGLVQCPKRHTAVLHITRHSSFRCDLCGNGVERGRIMHGCRECDWDACEECTDKAESGVVKCAAIREIANDCRKLLTDGVMTKDSADSRSLASEAIPKYVSTIDEIGKQSAWKGVENVSVRLLRHDRKAIRDLALMLRTPGAITIHQFQNLILPALHVACIGRDDNKESGAGHKSKKAKVASNGYDKEASQKARKPEERVGFCMELVQAMILDVDETPRKPATLSSMLASEPTSGNDSDDGDEGSGESENEQRQVVNEREIAFFAEASELLRRLQQVLSLYENVNISTVSTNKKVAPGGDMQSLTKAIELHLSPSTFDETTSFTPTKLVLHAEPLAAMSDVKRHILRCCGTVDPAYEAYCRR